MPGVSWAGHLGGAVAGALVAGPLLYARFGPPGVRLLGYAGVALVPAGFFLVLTQTPLLTAPSRNASNHLARELLQTMIDKDAWASQLEERFCRSLLRKIPADRWDDPDQAITAAVTRASDDFRTFAQRLASVEGVPHSEYAQGLVVARDYLTALVRYYDLILRCVNDNSNWTALDEEQLKRQAVDVTANRNRWRSSPFLVVSP
jgi:hypothetical protein